MKKIILGILLSTIFVSSALAFEVKIVPIDSVNGKTVTGYDYTNSCHVSGTLPNLYHYGQSAHINFNEVGDGTYNGYDYGSSCHFNVQVRSGNVQIYDYGESGYFSYSG